MLRKDKTLIIFNVTRNTDFRSGIYYGSVVRLLQLAFYPRN